MKSGFYAVRDRGVVVEYRRGRWRLFYTGAFWQLEHADPRQAETHTARWRWQAIRKANELDRRDGKG